MTISREDVLRVAELAQLELTPEEAELYRGQLDEILNLHRQTPKTGCDKRGADDANVIW